MDNRRGILLMVTAMAGFAVADAFIKGVSAEMPTGQIVVCFSVPAAAIFAVRVRRDRGSIFSRDLLTRPALIRTLGEMVATTSFVAALGLIPLATASAIQQAAPLAVTAGAALVFGEAVGWRRWVAVAVGFLGVLMIVRPGAESFQPAALLALLAVAGFAVRDLATWSMPARISTNQLATWALAASALAGTLLTVATSAWWIRPSLTDTLALCGVTVASAASYWSLTEAMRAGELSVIAPFRYSRLIFALLIAIAVFSERPDAWTLAGAAVIILTGVYTLDRERRLRRTIPPASLPTKTDMTS